MTSFYRGHAVVVSFRYSRSRRSLRNTVAHKSRCCFMFFECYRIADENTLLANTNIAAAEVVLQKQRQPEAAISFVQVSTCMEAVCETYSILTANNAGRICLTIHLFKRYGLCRTRMRTFRRWFSGGRIYMYSQSVCHFCVLVVPFAFSLFQNMFLLASRHCNTHVVASAMPVHTPKPNSRKHTQ